MNNNNQFLKLQTILTEWLAKNKQTSPADIRIGLWGTSGSGKTTYLAMLYDALEDSEEWTVEAGNDLADGFIDAHISTIDAGNFPPPTEISEDLKVFTYILKKGASSIFLNFLDAAGGFYEDFRGNATQQVEIVETNDTLGDIVDYLRSCDGIIFLLDPIRSKKQGESYKTLLLRLFREFQKRSRQKGMDTKLQQYMAFCVTKSDKEGIWDKGSDSPNLVKDVMGEKLFKRLSTNFCLDGRYEFFSVASIGRYLDKTDKKWKESVIYPDIPDRSNTSEPQPPQPSPQKGYSEGYDPDGAPGKSNTSSSSSSPSDDEWATQFNQTSNTPEPPSIPLPTINTDVNHEPFNVIKPIEWLIKSIQKNPPSRPQPKQKS